GRCGSHRNRDLFEELEDLSDSGPELDTMSISSTPKPSLRPFFSSSRSLLQETLNVPGQKNWLPLFCAQKQCSRFNMPVIFRRHQLDASVGFHSMKSPYHVCLIYGIVSQKWQSCRKTVEYV
ncbi:hypothetical protein L9F63_026537, partial [Diploptera punctata]